MAIKNKSDLKYYIKKDRERNKLNHPLLQRITFSEDYPLYAYLKNLRFYEYYLNNPKWYTLPFLYFHRLRHRRLTRKNNIFIAPNTIGWGVQLMHPGFRRIDIMVECGNQCTILPMVLMGKKRPGEKGEIKIGNNCYIGTGVTILGPITIGDNVTIAAGAVVVDNIPNDCVIGGIPAKILKYKNKKDIYDK